MADIIIVGAGTAGLTAAIYAVRGGKSALVLEAVTYGGQIVNTPEIENYPGLYKVSGFDYATKLYEQAVDLGADIRFETVKRIEKDENGFKVTTDQDVHEGKAVILATGAKNRPLGVAREQELVGRGISYCATCDGMFYRGKVTAVAGGGNTAIEDAQYLADLCDKVYLIHRRDSFRADVKEVEKLKAKDNVEFVLNANVTELVGEPKLSAVRVEDKFTKEVREIPVDGLFVAIGQMPANEAFTNVALVDEKGYIVSGENCLTNTPGVFTAGDCRTKEVRQLTTAASDGAVAALAALKFIG